MAQTAAIYHFEVTKGSTWDGLVCVVKYGGVVVGIFLLIDNVPAAVGGGETSHCFIG